MRVLSLWQPWSSLIAVGLKKDETRSWGTDYRGGLLTHATKSQPVCITGQLEQIWRESGFAPAFRRAFGNDDRGLRLPLPQGAILTSCTLVDCLEMWDSQVYGPLMPPHRRGADIASITELERAVGDWQEGRFDWKLDNIIALPNPIPWKGAQGLRNAPPDLVELVNQQLKEVA